MGQKLKLETLSFRLFFLLLALYAVSKSRYPYGYLWDTAPPITLVNPFVYNGEANQKTAGLKGV